MAPNPIVRYLIACEDILVDPAKPTRVHLIGLLGAITSLQAPPFPMNADQICVYAMLANGRGVGEVRVEICFMDTGDTIYRSPKWPVSFSSNPLLTLGIRFRIEGVQFSEAGLYSIELWYNNVVVGTHELLVR